MARSETQLLDRLMRRSILAVAHGVVGEDENGRQLHQRGQPDGRPRIVAEDEEGRAEGPQLGQRQAVDDRRHGVLADAEMEIAAAGTAGLEVARAGELQRRLVRRAEVGRAAQEPGNVLGEHVQHLARGVAAGDALGVGREARQVAVPARGQLAPLHLVDLGGELRELLRGSRRRAPPSARRAAAPRAPMPASKCSHDAVGHEELGILRPAVGALGEPDLVVAQRLAMGRGGVVLVRRAVADVAVEDDQRRPALGLAEDRERVLDALEVVGVADAQHVPAVGEEARGDILGEGDAACCLRW